MKKANYDKFPVITVPKGANACITGSDTTAQRLRETISGRNASRTVVVNKYCTKRITPHPFGLIAAGLLTTLDLNATKVPFRQTVPLDGTWQITEGSMTNRPPKFDHTVPVPGLVDLAQPPFVEPGPKVAKRDALPQKDPRRDAYWYRRTFDIKGPLPPAAVLKVNKAMFGSQVYLNGRLLGNHVPCWTAGYFDLRPALKTNENELVIRIGADRDAIGRAYPDGFDYEKSRYIPGIFDSVTLMFSGTPRIENVQVAPEIEKQQAKVRVYLDGAAETPVEIEVREAKSRRLVGRTTARMAVGTKELDVVVPVKNCRFWSPEDPFLYQLVVRTTGDEFATRFGMREFILIRCRGVRCSTASRISCAAAISRSTGFSRTASAARCRGMRNGCATFTSA